MQQHTPFSIGNGFPRGWRHQSFSWSGDELTRRVWLNGWRGKSVGWRGLDGVWIGVIGGLDGEKRGLDGVVGGL